MGCCGALPKRSTHHAFRQLCRRRSLCQPSTDEAGPGTVVVVADRSRHQGPAQVQSCSPRTVLEAKAHLIPFLLCPCRPRPMGTDRVVPAFHRLRVPIMCQHQHPNNLLSQRSIFRQRRRLGKLQPVSEVTKHFLPVVVTTCRRVIACLYMCQIHFSCILVPFSFVHLPHFSGFFLSACSSLSPREILRSSLTTAMLSRIPNILYL